MKRTILLSALLSIPLIATADTMTMRDGTVYNGTFLGASGQVITFAGNNGVRHRVYQRDVSQVTFGDYDNSYSSNDSGSYAPAPVNSGPATVQNDATVLNQLAFDIQDAMNDGDLSFRNRRILDRDRDILNQASTNLNNGYSIDYGRIRHVMDEVQMVAQSGQITDRDQDKLMRDLSTLRSANYNYDSSRFNSGYQQ